MVTKKLTFLLLTSLILSNVGCSGSRLRNMVGRSEYSSLDELEARESGGPLGAQGESLANGSGNDGTSSLVSESQELDSADPVVVQKRRKGFFDFAKVFNRKSNDDEFAPDPFSEAKPSTEVKTVSLEADAKPVVKQQVATTADKFSSTISAVEQQSENLFDESLAKTESAFFETEPATNAVPNAISQATDVESQEDSFADFVRDQAVAGVDAVVADVKQEAVTNLDKVSSATTEPTEFDALLSGASDGFEQAVAADSPSALFPGLSEEFDAAFEESGTAPPSEADFADVVASVADPAVLESTFVETAQKHGFSTAESKDPWAAFGQGRSEVAMSQPQPVAEPKTAAANNDFVWGRAVESAAEPAVTFNDTQSERLHETPDQAFLQVSSTRPLETRAPVEVSDSMPLIIPGGSSSSQPSPIHSDPFLAAVPAFDETADFPTESEVAAAVPTVATAEGGLSQWPRRTWFLLIGCLIVALLLFMPDRHNRTNA